ncbi:uncharacterized protein TNCT_171391 [Trichonephila clavata]|uniref:Uncharacterized protein n=1 Tax=Trichonephila clavata TaxID=2740835 RepID=A0A8X6JFJ9_TRICU|nr:uncharacterized protein TNCT_171391 [Trichonephila clavata]
MLLLCPSRREGKVARSCETGVKPLTVPSIIGIVLGVLILVIIGVSVYFWYRWREKKIRGYGDKSRALTADATDLEEIAGLESGKKPIPVTVL